MFTENQDRILAYLAGEVPKINSSLLIVGIDGKDASGKTTFANNLAITLQKLTDRKIIRVSLDDFFHPRANRSHQADQAKGCYEDTFNIEGIITYLLAPLKKNGRYTQKIFDYESDSHIEVVVSQAPADAIVVIDGVFLQRPEFRDFWDYTVLLEVSDEMAIKRGSFRDAVRIGDVESAKQKYINRYIASQKIYYDECHPKERASIVINNSDYDNPAILDRPIRHG